MSRLRSLMSVVGLVGASVLAGCGGGGSTAPKQNVTPPPLSGRYITGTVVSSATGRGVDGVVIRLGGTAYSAVTRNGGKFEINVGSADTVLPYYFRVDTSGAGANFPSTSLVTFNNGQTYYPDSVDMPVGILNGDTDNLGTITVVEITDTNNPPEVPYPSHDTVIMGRVVRESDGAGLPNVRVDFGWTPVKITRTGAKGFFAVNLGRDQAVLSLFPPDTWPPTFKIDTSGAGLSTTLKVEFGGQQYSQDSIVVPTPVLSMETTALGTIKVLDGSGGGGGGGGEPPPPPPPVP
ncbi:MAG: hypothetical protein ACP5R5_06155 [Armatimonadota bacterium]